MGQCMFHGRVAAHFAAFPVGLHSFEMGMAVRAGSPRIPRLIVNCAHVDVDMGGCTCAQLGILQVTAPTRRIGATKIRRFIFASRFPTI